MCCTLCCEPTQTPTGKLKKTHVTWAMLKHKKSLHIPVEYLYAPSENISVKYEKPDLSPAQLAVFRKHFKMDIIMYEMAETKLGIRMTITDYQW